MVKALGKIADAQIYDYRTRSAGAIAAYLIVPGRIVSGTALDMRWWGWFVFSVVLHTDFQGIFSL